MSTRERLGRLNGLLERVQSRAGLPRTNGAHAVPVQTAFATAEYASPGQATPVPSDVAPVADVDDLLAAAAARDPSGYPSGYPDAEAAAAEYDSDMDSADVEVSTETVEIDIDVDEPMAMESGAQPIAHPTMPPEDLEEVEEEEPRATEPPSGDELEEVGHAAQPAAANEIEEPAPSSSRRPIAGEETPAEAYEGESAPRHTPPPESGKQVAAAPSAHPPSRKPSAPPPTAPGEREEREDRTLIGGWREPGLGAPPMMMGSPPAPASAPRPAEAPPAAQASGRRLSPDITRPNLPPGNVATFAGAAPAAKPATLGELLDMTLGL